MPFSPTEFGRRLEAMRGEMSLQDLSDLSGIPVHRLNRYEKGSIEKPSFQDMILLAKALGITPNEIASLAGLWVLPETEKMSLGRGLDDLEALRQYMVELDDLDRERLGQVIHLAIVVDRKRRADRDREQSSDNLVEVLKRRNR